jgi:hypothetical protein
VTTESIGSRNRWHLFRTASVIGRERRCARSIEGNSLFSWSCTTHFICRHQGESHAEWPYKHAPTPTSGVVSRALAGNEYGCCPLAIQRVSKCPEKLCEISRTSPRRSAIRECRRGRKLLPARRALFQIDVRKPSSDVADVVRCLPHSACLVVGIPGARLRPPLM